jgi:hypothetical protein
MIGVPGITAAFQKVMIATPSLWLLADAPSPFWLVSDGSSVFSAFFQHFALYTQKIQCSFA